MPLLLPTNRAEPCSPVSLMKPYSRVVGPWLTDRLRLRDVAVDWLGLKLLGSERLCGDCAAAMMMTCCQSGSRESRDWFDSFLVSATVSNAMATNDG